MFNPQFTFNRSGRSHAKSLILETLRERDIREGKKQEH